jgi:hypothetical protein
MEVRKYKCEWLIRGCLLCVCCWWLTHLCVLSVWVCVVDTHHTLTNYTFCSYVGSVRQRLVLKRRLPIWQKVFLICSAVVCLLVVFVNYTIALRTILWVCECDMLVNNTTDTLACCALWECVCERQDRQDTYLLLYCYVCVCGVCEWATRLLLHQNMWCVCVRCVLLLLHLAHYLTDYTCTESTCVFLCGVLTLHYYRAWVCDT